MQCTYIYLKYFFKAQVRQWGHTTSCVIQTGESLFEVITKRKMGETR